MLLSLLSLAVASPLNPWGSATPRGAALVNPYLYVYADAAGLPPARPVDWAATTITALLGALLLGGLARYAALPPGPHQDS